jgi:hypothetical protein
LIATTACPKNRTTCDCLLWNCAVHE